MQNDSENDPSPTTAAECIDVPEDIGTDRDKTYRLRLWQILLTFIGGVAAAVITGVVPAWIQKDVRNQVYEATYEDKRRTLQAQSELLRVQEEYMNKLEDVRLAREKIAAAEVRLREREAELERLRAEHAARIASLRGKYRDLEYAERKRRARKRARAAMEDRIAPYAEHGCRVDSVIERVDGRVCDRGYVAIFAEGTPDEKVIVKPSATCGRYSFGDWEPANNKCEKYARSFLLTKKLSAADVDSVLMRYKLNHVLGEFEKP